MERNKKSTFAQKFKPMNSNKLKLVLGSLIMLIMTSLSAQSFEAAIVSKKSELNVLYFENEPYAYKDAKGNLVAKLAEITFEYALMIESEDNFRIIKNIYQDMHSGTDLLQDSDPLKDRAMNLLYKLYSNKDKSELAHRLAIRLEINQDDYDRFTVPNYIKEGIKWVTKGEK